MTISVNTSITHRYLVISFGWCKLVNAPLFWPKAPSLALQGEWIQSLSLCTLMLLFSAQQKISFLSRLGPPEVISFKNWAAFKHQWPLKIKGQRVNSTQPRSQTFPLLEMKGIFKKTSCAWSCLHFCPTTLFGQGCQRLSEHAEHKTKMCCPPPLWLLLQCAVCHVGPPRDTQVAGWFVILTQLRHCCPMGAFPGRHSGDQHPVTPCGRLLQEQPQEGAGLERRGPWVGVLLSPLCPHQGVPGN